MRTILQRTHTAATRRHTFRKNLNFYHLADSELTEYYLVLILVLPRSNLHFFVNLKLQSLALRWQKVDKDSVVSLPLLYQP
jgi:hypothetical protein